MIKKIIYLFILITLSLITLVIIYLSFVGLETSKFNKIVINKIEEIDPNIQLSIEEIKIKFDLEKIQLHFSTVEPKVVYQNIKIPITEISIYSKISSVLKSKNEINQAIVLFQNFNTKDVQKLAVRIKPSNFKTYLLNNLNNGKIKKLQIDVKLDKDLNIIDYKVNGSVKKINISLLDGLLIQDINLNFISDKSLTLINSISAKYKGILISNGSVNLKKNNEIEIKGKFNSQFNLNESEKNKLFSGIELSFLKKIK